MNPLYHLQTVHLTCRWLVLFYFFSLPHVPTALRQTQTLGIRTSGNSVENAYYLSPSTSLTSPSVTEDGTCPRSTPERKGLQKHQNQHQSSQKFIEVSKSAESGVCVCVWGGGRIQHCFLSCLSACCVLTKTLALSSFDQH